MRAAALAVLAMLLSGCSARPAASGPGPIAARFHAPDEVLVLPEEAPPPEAVVKPAIRYPIREMMGGEGAMVITAFVIDTTGAVEERTVSFLKPARKAFLASVCNALRSVRFAPWPGEGGPRRVLVVMPFTFAPFGDVLRGLPPVDVASYRRALGSQPRDSVIAQLERAPHCP